MARNCILETPGAMLPRFLTRHKLTKEYRKALLFHNWHKIVGEDMARQVIPQQLNFKTLHVYIKNPVWANNFQYMKKDVIDKINQVVGKKIVDEILFSRWISRKEAPNIRQETKEEDFKQRLEKVELSPEDIVRIQEKLKMVKTEELREKFFKVMTLDAKRQKLRVLEQWIECEVCGKLIPPDEGPICHGCYEAEKEETLSELRAIFRMMPYVKYQQATDINGCTLAEYNRIKEETVQIWASKLRPGVDYPDKRVKNGTDDYSMEAKMLVMLYRSVSPEQLNKNLLARTIRKLKNNTAYWDLPQNT